jgi:hypothetical protein
LILNDYKNPIQTFMDRQSNNLDLDYLRFVEPLCWMSCLHPLCADCHHNFTTPHFRSSVDKRLGVRNSSEPNCTDDLAFFICMPNS